MPFHIHEEEVLRNVPSKSSGPSKEGLIIPNSPAYDEFTAGYGDEMDDIRLWARGFVASSCICRKEYISLDDSGDPLKKRASREMRDEATQDCLFENHLPEIIVDKLTDHDLVALYRVFKERSMEEGDAMFECYAREIEAYERERSDEARKANKIFDAEKDSRSNAMAAIRNEYVRRAGLARKKSLAERPL